MGTSERRTEIMRILCRRRHETISNLASEFGVSERTIRRDIEALSAFEPVYTQSGRHGGGVYVMDGYSMERMYMSETEINVLHKLSVMAENESVCTLRDDEINTLKQIITQYTKPRKQKGN